MRWCLRGKIFRISNKKTSAKLCFCGSKGAFLFKNSLLLPKKVGCTKKAKRPPWGDFALIDRSGYTAKATILRQAGGITSLPRRRPLYRVFFLLFLRHPGSHFDHLPPHRRNGSVLPIQPDGDRILRSQIRA